MTAATALSVYKPAGRTSYGWRKQLLLRGASVGNASMSMAGGAEDLGRPWWMYVLLALGIVLIVVLHILGLAGHH